MLDLQNNKKINVANYNEVKRLSEECNFSFNCWGATLYILGIEDSLEWTEEWEMQNFLSDQTNEINDCELEVGDILSLWYEDRLLHTAIYIGNGNYFHKMGADKLAVNDLIDIQDIYYEFNKTKFHRLKKG